MNFWRLPARAIGVIATVLIISSCEDLFKPPPPVSLVMFLDSSASFEPQMKQAHQLMRDVARDMDAQNDRVVAFRMASDVTWIYDNKKVAGRKLKEALEGYLKVEPDDRGTAYGTALTRSIAEAQDSASKTRRTAVLVIGDGADENTANGGNIQWSKLPKQFEALPESARLYFLFIQPRNGDRLRETLKPVLHDRVEFFTPQSSSDGTAKHRILGYLKHNTQETK